MRNIEGDTRNAIREMRNIERDTRNAKGEILNAIREMRYAKCDTRMSPRGLHSLPNPKLMSASASRLRAL